MVVVVMVVVVGSDDSRATIIVGLPYLLNNGISTYNSRHTRK